MKLIALTDIHGRMNYFPAVADKLPQADVVLLPGDITMFGREKDALDVVEQIRSRNPNVLAVMGNCDYPEVQQFLDKEGICIHAGHRIVNGVAFVGLGGSLPCPLPTLNEWSENEIEGYLAKAAAEVPQDTPMVLVSHQPAIDTATDIAGNGQHVGSRAVRAFIELRQPLLCFSGHIHESVGRDKIGETELVNPGPFMDGAFAVAEIGDTVESVEILRVA